MTAAWLVGGARPFGAEIAAGLVAEGYQLCDPKSTTPLDVLVINVPVSRGNIRFADITDADLSEALQALVYDVIETVQAALPRLAPGGRIVVVAARGHLGAWGGVHLMAANAALIALMRSMAMEFSNRGLRVNALAPDFAGEPWDTPAARADIADAAIFLARPGLQAISGQTLLFDSMQSLRLTESRAPRELNKGT